MRETEKGEDVGEGRWIEFAVSPDRKMKAEIKKVQLKKLKLDPRNVRFHHLPGMLTDKEIEDRIWLENDTKALFREILASKGLTEPPMIDSTFLTREGNRRVVCLRKLSERTHNGEYPGFEEDWWDSVLCYVLEPGTPEKDIAILLGRVHVSGKKEWRALNQAAHLWELAEKHGLTQDDVRSLFSMSKVTVNRMIRAFQATTDYGKAFPEDKDWVAKFSYFYELYKRPKLAEWADNNGNLALFSKWIVAGKLERGMDVRQLPDIIANPEALAAMDNGGVKSAVKVLARTDPSVESKFFGRVKDMIDALNEVPREELIAATSDDARRQALVNLRSTVDDVLKNVEALKG